MAKKEEKDELEGVETTPHAHAQKETQEAAKKVREKSAHRSAKNAEPEEDEEEVTPATRARAQEELRAAIQRVQADRQKKAPDNKTK